MLKVGVTGGIGSGKSVVCNVFKALGVPVFNADEAARFLMESDAVLVQQIKGLLGEQVYKAGKLDAKAVSNFVFKNPQKLNELNAIVHPATLLYANKWQNEQTAPYTIKEAALFFEAGTNQEMDIMIGVSAPKALRIERAMKRSNLTYKAVEERMSRQMDDAQKMKLCNYIIVNDNVLAIIPQVLKLHQQWMEIGIERNKPC